MSGLLTALTINAQSLAAQSQGIQLSGKNISNVNNPAYSRERLILTDSTSVETSQGPVAAGVTADGVQQCRDSFLDADVTREISATAQLQALDTNLSTASADLGESINTSNDSSSITSATQSTSGISSAISNFFNDVQSWSAAPSDAVTKNALMAQASTLAGTINTTYSTLQTDQAGCDSKAASDTSSANGLLSKIASLNTQIATYGAIGQGSASDLIDQRQTDLETLAGYMDFTATQAGNGEMTITTNGASGPVTVVNNGSVTGAMSYNSSTSQLTWAPIGSTGTTLALQGGSLAGDINAKREIGTLLTNINNTAQQLTKSVNAGYQLNGGTADFFASSPATGIIQVDPGLTAGTLAASSTDDSGGNDRAQAVAAVATQTFSTSGSPPDVIDGTISGFYNSSVGSFSRAVSNTNSKLSDQQAVQNLVQAQQASVSGVSSDEDETNLMQYQRAYEAIAKIISTIDSALGTIISMGGAAT